MHRHAESDRHHGRSKPLISRPPYSAARLGPVCGIPFREARWRKRDRVDADRQGRFDRRTARRMSHIKQATIGALFASLIGAGMGFVFWARQLDYSGPNKHMMHVIGWMGLTLVTVAVALA